MITASRAVGVALALLLAAPATASAAYVTSISLYSDPDDFIGQGVERVFDPGNTTLIGATMTDDKVVAYADPGGAADAFSFAFAAPQGQSLEPANYTDAERLPFRKDGHPGMSITGGNRECNELRGQFEVRDIAVDGAGNVERLWVVFEQHCEGAQPAAFGEVRIGAWVPDAADAVAPGIVRWPELDQWRRAATVPVSYTGGATVTGAALVGPNAGDFQLDAGACAGRAGPCNLAVGFAPSAGGVRQATLRVTDTRGGVHETALEAFAHGGTTVADVEVLSGNVADTPGHYVYRPADSQFFGNYHKTIEVYAERPEWDHIWGRFGAGGATPLAPGQYPNAAGDAGARPWLWVYGTHARCNATGGEFRVNSISLMPDGRLRAFDVSFRQDCYDDHRPALSGRWQLRAGSDEPLAEWMFPGPRPRIKVPAATRSFRTLSAGCPDAVERGATLRLGTPRGDRIKGGRRSDFVMAGTGADRVRALGGRDCVAGGHGGDQLWGGSGGDVVLGEAGDDLLVGGPGQDLLDCGPGRHDRAVAGRRDRVRGCERVRRVR